MKSTRLEAFSDAVIAIIMTIMVLELKIPHGADLDALPFAADLSRLRDELYLFGDLLEQSPPHAAGDRERKRKGAVGKHAPPFLAIAGSFHDGLDGRESLRTVADRGLWCRPLGCGGGVHDLADGDRTSPRGEESVACSGGRQRFEREAFDRHLRSCDSRRLPPPDYLACVIRCGCNNVACARQEDRGKVR